MKTARGVIPTVLVALVALGSLTTAGPTAASTQSLACEVGKLKAAGKYAACRLSTEAKARRKAKLADFTKCEEKFARTWGKIEAKAAGACPVTGDLEGTRLLVQGQTQQVAADLAGSGSTAVAADVACESAKLKAAGKNELCKLTAAAKARTNGQAADYTRCSATLAKKWAKAEDRAEGACPTSGDLLSVSQSLTEHATEIAASVGAAVCGNGVVEAGETCDGSDPLSACSADQCLADCTCSVCCDLSPAVPNGCVTATSEAACADYNAAFGLPWVPPFDAIVGGYCTSTGCRAAPVGESVCCTQSISSQSSPTDLLGTDQCSFGSSCSDDEFPGMQRVGATCTASGCEGGSLVPTPTPTPCVPSCGPFNQCGSNGCGGVCGTCPAGRECEVGGSVCCGSTGAPCNSSAQCCGRSCAPSGFPPAWRCQ